MKRIPLFLLAGMTLLFACSKSNDDPPATDPTKEAAAKLQKDVQGKWHIDGNINVGRVAQPQRATVLRTLTGRVKPQQVQTNGTSGTDAPPMKAFIEFNSDSTYIIFDDNQKVYTGKFEAKTGDSISLAGFGYLTGIAIESSKLTFKLHYSATSKTISITSNKAEPVKANDRTTLFCQHPWYVTTEADGAEMLNYEDWEYVDGKEVSYIVDSITITMSKNGTYLIQQFSKSKLKRAEMARWQWHSTKADHFAYNWDDRDFDEENNVVQITELTSSVLKVIEKGDDNGDGIVETSQLVLRPAIRK